MGDFRIRLYAADWSENKLFFRYVQVQFEVARASCACFHGRDARVTLQTKPGRFARHATFPKS
jgi:hypothetical protein